MNDGGFNVLFRLLETEDYWASYEKVVEGKPWLKSAHGRLTKAYKEDETTRAILDRFANISKNICEITVDKLDDQLPFLRTAIIASLKQLGEYRWGTFKNGRKGHPSRFESPYSLRKIGQLAGHIPEDLEKTKGVRRWFSIEEEDHGEVEEISPFEESTQPESAAEAGMRELFLPAPNDKHWRILVPKILTSRDYQHIGDYMKVFSNVLASGDYGGLAVSEGIDSVNF